MSTQRKLIRDAIEMMISGNTSAGTNVYANRTAPAWRSELPMILISAQSESAQGRDTRSRQYIRTLTLSIDVYAEANDDLDDTLDTISSEIESIIRGDVSLTGTSLGTIYTGTEMSLDADGEKAIGKLTLNFETKYIE